MENISTPTRTTTVQLKFKAVTGRAVGNSKKIEIKIE